MNEQQGRQEEERESVDTTVDGQPGDDYVTVVVEEKPRREMTARGAAAIGATIAAILGAVFFASYSLTGFMYCTGFPREACPSSWVPYAILATTGFVVVTLLGAFAGWAFFKLYGLMRVD